MKKTLYVCEKISSAKEISLFIKPNDEIILSQSVGKYNFNYQDVKFSESPYTKETPIYKLNKNTLKHFDYVLIKSGGEVTENEILKEYMNLIISGDNLEKCHCLVEDFLKKYDEIVFACDFDHRGFRAFEFKFEKYFNLGKNWVKYFEEKGIKLSYLFITAIHESVLPNTIKNKLTINKNSKEFNSLRDFYIKKDFFEYNYNLNTMLFFGSLITKNYVMVMQLLFKNENMNIMNLIDLMNDRCIGTASSTVEIINKLKENDYVINDSANYSLSEKGLFVLEKMHPKMNDPYLGQRLNKDVFELELNDYINKYEKYLYNTFSKQKRFLRKIK